MKSRRSIGVVVAVCATTDLGSIAQSPAAWVTYQSHEPVTALCGRVLHDRHRHSRQGNQPVLDPATPVSQVKVRARSALRAPFTGPLFQPRFGVAAARLRTAGRRPGRHRRAAGNIVRYPRVTDLFAGPVFGRAVTVG